MSGIRFGVVVGFWRCGRNKNTKAGQRIVPGGTVPANVVTTVHMMFLMPFKEANTFMATLLALWGSLFVYMFFYSILILQLELNLKLCFLFKHRS